MFEADSQIFASAPSVQRIYASKFFGPPSAGTIGGTLARRARAGRAPGIFLDPCPTGDLLGGALRGALRTIFESTLRCVLHHGDPRRRF